MVVLPAAPVVGSTRNVAPPDQTDLLAVVGVPSAVLALTVFFMAFQQPRQSTPEFYPQRL